MSAFGQVRRIAQPSSGAAVLAGQARAQLSGRQVLLAEDNEFNQIVAKELLADVGIETTLAGNGQQAVDLALAGGFDLVLMDIQMPVMDGLDATRRLRREARLADLPIIAMTAHAMVTEHDKCLSVGMNDFLSKPVDPDQLYATLMRWIKPADRALVSAPAVVSSAPASDDLPAAIAGISLREGLRYCGGKTGFYLRMLHQFRQSKAGLGEEIRRLIEAGDLDAARRLTHTNKSIAAHLGADSLADAARALEQALNDGDDAAIGRALTEFAVRLNSIIESLQQALPERTAAAPVGAASENAAALLPQLAELLQRDLGRALRLERKIRPALESGPLADDYAEFRRHLEVFDTRAALESLKRLIDANREKQGVS